MDLQIVPVQRGIRGEDFGIEVEERDGETVLAVPEAFANEVCARWGVHTAGELVSFIETFTEQCIVFLQWQRDEVRAALLVLCRKLRGHVDDQVLDVLVEDRPRDISEEGARAPASLSDEEECS